MEACDLFSYHSGTLPEDCRNHYDFHIWARFLFTKVQSRAGSRWRSPKAASSSHRALVHFHQDQMKRDSECSWLHAGPVLSMSYKSIDCFLCPRSPFRELLFDLHMSSLGKRILELMNRLILTAKWMAVCPMSPHAQALSPTLPATPSVRDTHQGGSAVWVQDLKMWAAICPDKIPMPLAFIKSFIHISFNLKLKDSVLSKEHFLKPKMIPKAHKKKCSIVNTLAK